MADGKKKQASIADGLREEVERRGGPEDGTIVVFTYNFNLEEKPKHRTLYTYAAVWIEKADLWYVTGQGNALPREQAHTAFMTMLAKPNVVEARVATEFSTFKP